MSKVRARTSLAVYSSSQCETPTMQRIVTGTMKIGELNLVTLIALSEHTILLMTEFLPVLVEAGASAFCDYADLALASKPGASAYADKIMSRIVTLFQVKLAK